MRNVLCSLFALCSLLSCKHTPSISSVNLRFTRFERSDTPIRLLTYNMLNYEEEEILRVQSDTLGDQPISILLANPAFYNLQWKDQQYELLLEPGADLEIIAPTEPDGQLRFAGKGAVVNDYLAEIGPVWSNLYFQLSDFQNWEEEVFKGVVQVCKMELDNFHDRFVDSTGLAADKADILSAYNDLELFSFVGHYRLANHELKWKTSELLKELGMTNLTIFQDATYARTAMQPYATVMDMYTQLEVYPPLIAAIPAEDLERRRGEIMRQSDQQFRDGNYAEPVREYLLARNLDYWLAANGENPVLDTLFAGFEHSYADSKYLKTLEKALEEWRMLAPGQPSPEIVGLRTDGTRFSTRELTGKIVYVDVWASWCVPCREEFKHYEKLVQNLAGFDGQVAFVFLSIDEDEAAWRELVQSGQVPEGIHLLDNSKEEQHSLHHDYKIWGIPRYFLIDQRGRIVSVNAPKASSAALTQMIRVLLE